MRIVVLCSVVLGACGSGGECPPGQTCDPAATTDAGPDAGAVDRCAAAVGELENALAQRGTCVEASDCMLIGGQFDSPTCNCAAFAGSCEGVPIASNAPQLATALSLIEELAACDHTCGAPGVECVCDCAPAGLLACTNGFCTAESQSCFEQ
jgi:hypothetical protein